MIQAGNLVKDYGIHRAVDNVSFRVEKGDILGFLGPNGAGKSTTMKMITGFLPPTEGEASIGGFDILTNPVEAKRNLGYLPESGPLYPEMTVKEFLDFIADIRELDSGARSKAMNRVVEICHLEEVLYQTIDTLSKGFRQRVGMAQAIIHDPSYLIMDEPTDGLDPNQKMEVRKLISSMAKDKAIILSTHILEEVKGMCNRIIIIAEGKLIVDDTPDSFAKRHKLSNSVVANFKNVKKDKLREKTDSADCIKKIESRGDEFIVHGTDRLKAKEALWDVAKSNNWQVVSIENAETPFEDIFADLTKGSRK